jgi:hypothetical protein
MKVEKLFNKLESFFDMNKKEQIEQKDKKEKLSNLLNEKIDNKKKKIKDCTNKEKKHKFKIELEMLRKLLKKYNLK